MGQIPTRDELFELYRIHADEIRFEVKLNWDRTQYLLVLNIGILGAAATIWKSDAELAHYLLLCGLFLVGLCTSIAAQAAIRKGHGYYHNARRQKTLIEHLLKLHGVQLDLPNLTEADLTISTTGGMSREIAKLSSRTEEEKPAVLERGQVTWYLIQIFKLLVLLNLLGLSLGFAYVVSFSSLGNFWKVGTFDFGLFASIGSAIIVPLLIFAWLQHKLASRRSRRQ